MTEQQCECDPLDHGLDCPLRMTEQHECDWEIGLAFWEDEPKKPIPWAQCRNKNCKKIMNANEIEARLNEYETLKKATERLSAEETRTNIIIYGEGGFVTDQFLESLRAYANILEGK